MIKTPLGQHLIMEMMDCPQHILSDLTTITDAMLGAAQVAGATIVGTIEHPFDGGGVTVVIGLAESHLSIHTWPEFRYAMVDICTCGNIDQEAASNYLVTRLKSARYIIRTIKRGVM